MSIIKTQINFEDARGSIRDILTHTDFNACTLITFTPNAIRGNHYHEKTIQYDYVLKGKLESYMKLGSNGETSVQIVGAGDLIEHPINERHAYKALDYAEILSFTCGPRQGGDYEQDTIRLVGPDKLIG